jgi:hypothetical protein
VIGSFASVTYAQLKNPELKASTMGTTPTP